MSRCDWTCFNTTTGVITLSVDYIESAIINKNSKASTYSRNGTSELWLLVSAAGDRVNTRGLRFHERAMLDDARLMSCCSSSPFDRIAFWERIAGWYKWLKPNTPATNYRGGRR
jgi:hypothetical protein